MFIGSYGTFYFEVAKGNVDVLQNFSKRAAARYEEHKVAGGKPLLEYIAPELQEISLTIRLITSIRGGSPSEVARIWREMCEKGEVHRLVLGTWYHGEYVITELNEAWNRANKYGAPTDLTLDVTFREYK